MIKKGGKKGRLSLIPKRESGGEEKEFFRSQGKGEATEQWILGRTRGEGSKFGGRGKSVLILMENFRGKEKKN